MTGTLSVSGRVSIDGQRAIVGGANGTASIFELLNGQWVLSTTITDPRPGSVVSWVGVSGNTVGILAATKIPFLTLYELTGSGWVQTYQTTSSNGMGVADLAGDVLLDSPDLIEVSAGRVHVRTNGQWAYQTGYNGPHPPLQAQVRSAQISGSRVLLKTAGIGGQSTTLVGQRAPGGSISTEFYERVENPSGAASLDQDTLLLGYQGSVSVQISDLDGDTVPDGFDPCPNDGEDDCVPRQGPPAPPAPQPPPSVPGPPGPPPSTPQAPSTPSAPSSSAAPGPAPLTQQALTSRMSGSATGRAARRR